MTAVNLEAQIEELRGALTAVQAMLGSRLRLQLFAVEPAPYLGQSVALTATVTESDGSPASSVPVTLVTSWGELRGEDDLIEGRSISTVTGADGVVRATLRPGASVDDSEEQDAIEGVLALLDPAAASPAAVTAALQNMASQYRWEANLPYRNAVDAYFRDFGQKVLHNSVPRDYTVSWPRIPATVIAFLGGQEQTVAATVTVRFRDWLGAWLQIYRQLTTSENPLAPGFQDVKKQALGPSGLIAGIFDRASIYVDSEFGFVGKKIAQDAAQSAIGKFLDAGVSDLPADTRTSIGSVLATGSRALASSGPGVLAVLGQTHVATESAAGAIANKVDKADFSAGLAGKANAVDLQAVQIAVGAKADVSALDGIKAQTAAALATKANSTDLQAVQTAIGAKADKAAFDTFQSQINAAIATKANATDLQAVQTAIGAKADKAAFDTFQSQINAAIATKANSTDLQAVQTAIGAKADKAAFDTFQSQINAAIATKANATDLQAVQTAIGAKADKAALDAFQVQVNTALGRKADLTAFQAFQTATNTAIAGKVDSTTFEGFRRQVNERLPLTVTRADLDTLSTTLQASINAKADVTALNAFQGRLGNIERRIP